MFTIPDCTAFQRTCERGLVAALQAEMPQWCTQGGQGLQNPFDEGTTALFTTSFALRVIGTQQCDQCAAGASRMRSLEASGASWHAVHILCNVPKHTRQHAHETELVAGRRCKVCWLTHSSGGILSGGKVLGRYCNLSVVRLVGRYSASANGAFSGVATISNATKSCKQDSKSLRECPCEATCGMFATWQTFSGTAQAVYGVMPHHVHQPCMPAQLVTVSCCKVGRKYS